MSIAGLKEGTLSLGGALRGIGIDPVTLGLTAAITAISLIANGIKKYNQRFEEMKENLNNSVSEFKSATDELKSLEEELKTTTERLEELQNLADSGTISTADEAELETLKKTNKELARKVALKQQEQAQEARDVLKDSKKNANSTLSSKYKMETIGVGKDSQSVSADVTPDEELLYAIEKYNHYVENGDIYDYSGNSMGLEPAKDRVEEMYALISPTIDAYEELIAAGIELEGEDKTRYEQLKKSQDAYLAYVYTLNGTREAFEGLNAEQQRNVLLNRLVKQGLSEDVANAIVGSISDEDLEKFWDKDFSFTPPEMKDGETAEEYGKRYAEAWAKGLEEGAKNDNKMTVSLSDSADKIKELNSILKELNDGGLSNDSIEKIISDYPELIGYIGDEVKLRTELKKKIAEEENKYKQALRNKVMASSSFAELVESKNQTLFKELGLAYNKDTQKFEIENEKKVAIAKLSASEAAKAWAQIYADEQVLSAPDYSQDLHDAGKNSKYRDKDGNWHFETYNDGQLKTWVYESGSAMAKILDSQRELSNISNFDIDFGDDGSSSSDKNEVLDNYLKDAENRYKIHQDETKYIQELQWAHDNLTKDEKERLDIIGKINEAYRDLADNRIKDLEHQIDLKKELYGEDYNATSEWTEIQRIAHEEAERLRAMGYDNNSNEIQELQKKWWDAENSKLEFYSRQHENIIRDIEHARDMALNADENADVTSYYRRLQEEYHKEAERLRLLDPEKYKEEIQEFQQLWWDAEKEILDHNKQVVEDFLDEFQKAIDDSYDIRISRLNSQSSLLSSHFDIVNAIAEEQHNLNKELLEAQTIGAEMNEMERESLFTKEEHTRLSSKLSDIMLDVTDLQHDYQRDLETATKDTIEEITNQYERQYELKMKEYEIVKAELALAKAQQVLENTKNEKSVRTWTGSGWSYAANIQDVIDAQEEVENAKYDLIKSKTEEVQQKAINVIDANADALETEKNKLATAIDSMAEKFNGTGKDITAMLETIAKTDLPMFDAIIQSLGDSIKNAFGISDSDINTMRYKGSGTSNPKGMSNILGFMQSNSEAWHTASESERTRLENDNRRFADYLGLDYEESTGRWKKKDGTYAYVSGTLNAKKGTGLFDEDGFGSELILTKDGILTQFDGGERVFSSEMADRLWEMAQQNYNFAPTVVQPDFGRLIPIEDKISNAISNISNAFGDTYMIKDVQLNESEGGTLKGFINFLKKKV